MQRACRQRRPLSRCRPGASGPWPGGDRDLPDWTRSARSDPGGEAPSMRVGRRRLNKGEGVASDPSARLGALAALLSLLGRDVAPGDEEGAGREGELDALGLESLVDGEVDRLLDVHVEGVVRVQHVVDDLEVEAVRSVALEVGPVEADRVLGLDALAQDLRNALQLLARRLVDDAEAEDDAALSHASVVADPAAQQVGVREDELLSRQAANAGGLQADPLDRAEVVAQDQEVALD